MPISARITPVSQKVNFRPITFIGTGKPTRPVRPQAPNREPGRRGIQLSGKFGFKEFLSNIKQLTQPSATDLGRGAVKIMNSMGNNVNILA